MNTFGTFLRTPDGYRVTAPEGFVAIRSGQKAFNKGFKLVDRLEFSRANFTADKNWEKGNPMRTENMKSFTSFITEALSSQSVANLIQRMTTRQI